MRWSHTDHPSTTLDTDFEWSRALPANELRHKRKRCMCHAEARDERTSSHRSPCAPQEEHGSVVGDMPPGCCVGVPVVLGTPLFSLPTGKELFHVVMSFVVRDDYHGIIELARRGGTDVDFKRKCGFTVALSAEALGVAESFPRQLCVSDANLLHYAICVSSFRAALALLIACPSLLQHRCIVAGKQLDARGWAASELARLFCSVYQDGDRQVIQTAMLYAMSCPLLEIGEKDRKHLPFLALPTISERVAAAGPDGEAAIKAFLAARPAVTHHEGSHHVGDQAMCDDPYMAVSWYSW